jgi:hydrogenase expression/formation protein HypE
MDDEWAMNCPVPLRDYPHVVLGHGGGGRLSAELVESIFLPAFRSESLDALTDSAVLSLAGARVAMTTDSYVVRPLFFPGGSIGDLAVNGTVNDLAMSGARPMYITAGFILEEGLPMQQLDAVVRAMADAARRAGVQIVAGDTKVVDRGHGDQMYINTAGVGLMPHGVHIAPQRARPGDVVLVSGTLGDHGMAIMSMREGLQFESAIVSDCAPLHGLVSVLLEASREGVHVLRDPTRGGAAASLNEIAVRACVGIELDADAIPVRPDVAAACELLGLDPLYVANEGKLLAIVAAEDAEAMLAAMRAHEYGRDAAVIGRVVAAHPGMVTMRTALGGERIVPLPLGEQLPRIC